MADRLTKAEIKKYGITKEAWRVHRGKKRSSTRRKTRKTKIKRKRKVGKRKTRIKRRKSRTRIPIHQITGQLVAIVGEPNPGWSSTLDNAKAGRYDQAIQSYIAAWTGLRLGKIGGQQTTEIDIMGVLNPFDMRNAPAAKVALFTKLVTKLMKKFGVNPISKIPFLKDYVSFS